MFGDDDYVSYLIIAGVLLLPSLIIFIVMNEIRIRRERFHRRRPAAYRSAPKEKPPEPATRRRKS